MANMRNCRDTFLHYLSDNLLSSVHAVRFDSADAQANVLKNNAVNVTFSNSTFDTREPLDQLTSIDVLADTELSALDMAEQVITLLQSSAYTQLMDYSSGTATPVGKILIFWDTSVKFRPVHSDSYFHMSALLHLKLQFQ